MAVKVAVKTYWYTADKKEIVLDGDPRAAFLLVRQGSPVDAEVASFYGLETQDVEGNRIPMPGANNPSAIVSQAQAAATREVAHRTQNRIAAAGDNTTGFQVSSMIAHQVTDGIADAADSSEEADAIRKAPVDARARAAMEHAAGSHSGGDLFTGARVAEEAGERLGGAYEDRTGDNREAGASPVPEKPEGERPKANARAASVAPPAEAGGKGENLRPGVQEYTTGAGVAITPAGMEREDKTQPPPPLQPADAPATTLADSTTPGAPPPVESSAAAAPPAPLQTPAPLAPAPPQPTHKTPEVDKTLPEALNDADVNTGGK